MGNSTKFFADAVLNPLQIILKYCLIASIVGIASIPHADATLPSKSEIKKIQDKNLRILATRYGTDVALIELQEKQPKSVSELVEYLVRTQPQADQKALKTVVKDFNGPIEMTRIDDRLVVTSGEVKVEIDLSDMLDNIVRIDGVSLSINPRKPAASQVALAMKRLKLMKPALYGHIDDQTGELYAGKFIPDETAQLAWVVMVVRAGGQIAYKVVSSAFAQKVVGTAATVGLTAVTTIVGQKAIDKWAESRDSSCAQEWGDRFLDVPSSSACKAWADKEKARIADVDADQSPLAARISGQSQTERFDSRPTSCVSAESKQHRGFIRDRDQSENAWRYTIADLKLRENKSDADVTRIRFYGSGSKDRPYFAEPVPTGFEAAAPANTLSSNSAPRPKADCVAGPLKICCTMRNPYYTTDLEEDKKNGSTYAREYIHRCIDKRSNSNELTCPDPNAVPPLGSLQSISANGQPAPAVPITNPDSSKDMRCRGDGPKVIDELVMFRTLFPVTKALAGGCVVSQGLTEAAKDEGVPGALAVPAAALNPQAAAAAPVAPVGAPAPAAKGQPDPADAAAKPSSAPSNSRSGNR